MDVQIAAVAPELEVVAQREPSGPGSAEQRAIDGLWAQEVTRSGGRLYDDTVLAHVTHDRRRLVGRLVRRSDVHAGRVDPGLFGGRPPEPVSVQGLVTTRGRIVLGLRGAGSLGWPGRWELPPACPLDGAFLDLESGRLDATAQLLAELVETTPLPRPARTAVQPMALAFDEIERAWSLVLSIDLDLDEEAVRQVEEATSAAYETFRVARTVEVIEAGLWGGEELVPLSWALVRLPRPQARAA